MEGHSLADLVDRIPVPPQKLLLRRTAQLDVCMVTSKRNATRI